MFLTVSLTYTSQQPVLPKGGGQHQLLLMSPLAIWVLRSKVITFLHFL